MKILQVCPRCFPSIGGVEEHVRNISKTCKRIARCYVGFVHPNLLVFDASSCLAVFV
jgi:ribosomal protein L34E